MNKTESQQAQQYAEKKIESEYGISHEDFIEAGCRFGYDDVVQAYLDGYTAAEQSMWRSVEKELPEDDSYFYFVADINKNSLAVDCAEYTCETKKFSRGGQILHPTHWMHIPTLIPETNTEKI